MSHRNLAWGQTMVEGAAPPANGNLMPLTLDPATGRLRVDSALTVDGSDIQIGSVELKDGASNAKALVSPANTPRTPTDNVLLVQTVDAAGVIGGGSGGISLPDSISHADVQTSATGATWVTLASAACLVVVLMNDTGADIEVRRGGAGVAIPVKDGFGYNFQAITNADQLSLRRIDQSNTQVTLVYELVNYPA